MAAAHIGAGFMMECNARRTQATPPQLQDISLRRALNSTKTLYKSSINICRRRAKIRKGWPYLTHIPTWAAI